MKMKHFLFQNNEVSIVFEYECNGRSNYTGYLNFTFSPL